MKRESLFVKFTSPIAIAAAAALIFAMAPALSASAAPAQTSDDQVLVGDLDVASTLPASTPIEEFVADELVEQIEVRPGGTLVEPNRITYPDGSGFVAAPQASAMTIADCRTTWFCMWTANYLQGSFAYRTGPGTYSLSMPVRSLWNNRVNSTRFHNNSLTGSVCYGARETNYIVPIAYHYSPRVTLFSTTNC